jgi:hypothetical protein
MRRRFRLAVAVVALISQAVVPFAAYARAEPAAGFNDFCSVYGKAPTSAPAIPSHPGGRHASHCAFCPGGSASAAIALLFAPAIEFGATDDLRIPDTGDSAPAGTRILVPPSRGPPATSSPI